MDNVNKMRIICDPFKKKIEYKWYDSNKECYQEMMPENSKLTRKEFVRTAIQNRAYDIIDTINAECNVGNVGLKIDFVGTKDDYSDFCDVIKKHHKDSNIQCDCNTCYYNTADKVLPKIEKEFADVKSTLEDYSEDEVKKWIDKYNDVVKPSISLCIVGLYSAGKSAFINSIIGAEILPSASNPTTAKVYKIYCDNVYRICFKFDEEECVLTFEGATYKPSSSSEKEIIRELQKIVEGSGKHDEIFHMNQALKILNEYKNDKHKLSDLIEIHIPFNTVLPTDKFEFIIYDTPGSNSQNNSQHFKILKESLDEQTNALPIFLTKPDSMDATDNKEILQLIEKTDALDKTNTIVIVNQADTMGPDELEAQGYHLGNLSVTKWKSTRIFFMSSVLAIASKKNNPDSKDDWIIRDMYFKYRQNAEIYSSDEIKLFEYNIIDESKADDISGYLDSKKTTHLYKNSGLEAVEKEIAEYAYKYALYNKCQQASEYLQKAIDVCIKKIEENKIKQDRTLHDVTGKFDSKKKKLCNELENKKGVLADYNTEFQQRMEKDFISFSKENHLLEDKEEKHILQQNLKNEWKQWKEKGKKEKEGNDWSLSNMENQICKEYNGLFVEFSRIVNDHVGSFWRDKSERFKKECIKIIHGSDALTSEQKGILEKTVLSKSNVPIHPTWFDLREIGAIRNKKIFNKELKGEKFDAKLCCEGMVKGFNDAVRKQIGSLESEKETNFKKWVQGLINILKTEMCKFNSELHDYAQKIDQLEMERESIEGCQATLITSKKNIDSLFMIQGGEIDG